MTGTDREIDLSRGLNTTRLQTPSTPLPFADEEDPEMRREKLRDYWLSPEGTQVRHSRVYSTLQVDADGNFTQRHVPPGTYELVGDIRQTMEAGVPVLPRTIANVRHEVVVPEGADAVDLGTLEVPLFPGVNGERSIMDFSIETVDGEPLRLADFRGQYVQLDFWATWCGPCILEKPNIREVHEAYADDDRLVVIALSLDDEPDAPRDYAREHGFDWIQGFVGPSSSSEVPADFGVQGIPAIFLIGPEGEIVARDLRGSGIHAAVTQALARD